MTSKNLRWVSCVAAMSTNRGIGNKGSLPWPPLRTDLRFLEKITTEVKDKDKWNAVLLGRKTWESLGASNQPLTGRLNIVISKSLKSPPSGAHYVCDSVLSAVQMLSAPPFTSTVEKILVLGGTDVYKEAIESPFCHRIYLTRINQEFEADAFFPMFDENVYKLISNPSEVPQGVFEENQEAIESPFCHRIYLTRINQEFEADAFFPMFDENVYKLISNPSEVPQGVFEENQVQYKFCVYEKQC